MANFSQEAWLLKVPQFVVQQWQNLPLLEACLFGQHAVSRRIKMVAASFLLLHAPNECGNHVVSFSSTLFFFYCRSAIEFNDPPSQALSAS